MCQFFITIKTMLLVFEITGIYVIFRIIHDSSQTARNRDKPQRQDLSTFNIAPSFRFWCFVRQ